MLRTMKCSLRPGAAMATVLWLGVVLSLLALAQTESLEILGEAGILEYLTIDNSTNDFHVGKQVLYVRSPGIERELLTQPHITEKYHVRTGDSVRVLVKNTSGSSRRLLQSDAPLEIESIEVLERTESKEVFTGAQIRVKSLIYVFTMCGWPASATVEEIRNLYFNNSMNVNGYHQTCSYGKVAFDPSENFVLGPIEVPCTGVVNNGLPMTYNAAVKCSATEQLAWKRAGEAYARANGYGDIIDYTRSRRIIHILPKEVKCGWAGLGNVGCGAASCVTYIQGNYAKNLIVNIHELGHTLGLSHAGRGSNEYGDPTDVMGRAGFADGYMCMNAGNQYRMGWSMPIATLAPRNTSNLGNAGAPGRWIIPSTATTDVNHLLLTYKMANVLPNMFVSFRTRGVKYDNILPSENSNKVYVHDFNGTADERDYNRTLLVAQLGAGESYLSPFAITNGAFGVGVRITVLSIRPGVSATVQLCRLMQLKETADTCEDGLDNDCDGFADEADPDCSRTTVQSPPPPPSKSPPPRNPTPTPSPNRTPPASSPKPSPPSPRPSPILRSPPKSSPPNTRPRSPLPSPPPMPRSPPSPRPPRPPPPPSPPPKAPRA